MRGNFFTLTSIAILSGLLGVSPALANSKPIGGTLLKLKTDKGPDKNLFLFKAVKQPEIQAIPDPTVDTTLLLRWQTPAGPGRTPAIELGGNLWKGLGKPAGSKGWKYNDRDASAGGVKVLLIKPGGNGGLLKVLAKGASWAGVPDGELTSTKLDLYIGDDHYCAVWDGTNGDVKKNDPDGFFLVKGLSAPGSCEAAVCGNGRLEGSEECDSGSPFAVGTCNSDCTEAVTPPSTLETIQDQVFNPGCAVAGCHGAGFTAGNLSLSPGEAWGQLVNVDSSNPAAVVPLRVSPSNSRDESYLFLKIAALTLGGSYANPGGSPMPFGLPVSEDCLDGLGEWIEAGAPASGNVATADLLLSAACY